MALAPLGVRALHARRCATTRATRTGPTATGSCSRAGTRRCSCTRRCTWPATTSASRTTSSSFRQLGSRAAGHPEYGHLPGIEVTTGPLGQGISHAVGMALAERMLAARFNRPGHEIVDHRTFVIASDGDLEEGDLRRGLLDRRPSRPRPADRVLRPATTSRSRATPTLAFTEDVAKRYEAYGWHVQDLEEDIGLDRLEAGARATRSPSRTSRR